LRFFSPLTRLLTGFAVPTGPSTGLREALAALRLSIHNAVGIGGAENDHDLLDAWEVGGRSPKEVPRCARWRTT